MDVCSRAGRLAAAAVVLSSSVALGQDGANAGSGDGKLLPPLKVKSRSTPTLRAVVTPAGGAADGASSGGAASGVCPSDVITYADSNFEGTFVGTLPPGMVETEIAATSYTVPASDFPMLLDMTEFIIAQNHFNETTTEWTYIVWEGFPNTGQIIAQFSSDGTILPHVQLPVGGASAVNLQVSVDPGDPEQIVINDPGNHTFSVGFRIDAHNDPPTSSCVEDGFCCLPAVCCPPDVPSNAWPAMDQAGPQFPSSNWLWVRDCPGGCFPGLCFLTSGWYSFASASIPPQFVNDWAIRVTYTPLGCLPGAGACCLTDGSCSIEIETDCAAAGGEFQGDGVTCGAADCQSQLGACCFDGGCAEDSTLQDCLDADGTWLGAGTDCSGGDPCNPPGACCIPATEGCIALTEGNCAIAGGIWQGGGTTCGGTVCFGPCCLPDGSCEDGRTQQACASAGGTFQGAGTCATVSCPQPQGACCLPGGCLLLTQSDCAIVAGAWMGMSTTCADGNGNGTADDCEPPCDGDVNDSGAVDFTDLLAVLSSWGPCVGCPADLDGDGTVGFADLLEVLSGWGPC
jgi:hypothetical protein